MSTQDRTAPWLPTPAEGDEYLGRYRVIRRVGSGGMGVVYLGADPADRAVALKVLREHVAHDDGARARMRRELATLQRVRHRCVAGVIDADLDHHRPFIVTEFIDGPQLDDYIDDGGPLARDGLITLGRGLIGALAAIHDVGVVHRDLKPGNVLLHDHRPVVIDFGIAQHADDIRLTVTGLFVGTPGYVAPEVIAGDRASTATDWWGWAAVMVFAATGQSPAGTGPIEVVLDRIRRGELRLDAIDPDLRPLLADCLATDPSARPGQAEVTARFAAYADGGSTQRSTDRAAARVLPVSAPPAVPPAAPAAPAAAADERKPTAVLPARPELRRAGPPQRPVRDPAPRQGREKKARSARVAAQPQSHPGRRTGMIAALGALLVVLGASLPIITAGVLLALLTIARFTDRFATGLRAREEYAGAKRSNVAIEVALSPLSAGLAVLVAALSLVVPLGLGWLTAFVLTTLDGDLGIPLEAVGNITLGAAATIALLAVYWGPGGASTRRAARRTAQLLAPSRTAATALAALFLLGAAFFVVLIVAFPSITWWPLTDPLL